MNKRRKRDPFEPQPDDELHRLARALIAVVPIVGPVALEVFTGVIAEPAQRRRDKLLSEILERLAAMEQEGKLRIADLTADPGFQASFIQAAQSAIRTVQQEKLEMLRNAVLNSALAGDLDENIRQMFFQLIDRLNALHVALLKALHEPGGPLQSGAPMQMGSIRHLIESAVPQLKGKQDMLKLLVADLEGFGLASDVGLNITMTGSGMRASRTTQLGKSFLQFIADPETGKVP